MLPVRQSTALRLPQRTNDQYSLCFAVFLAEIRQHAMTALPRPEFRENRYHVVELCRGSQCRLVVFS